jgi:transcriptional regulator with XRE-family HTH domain
MDTLGDVIRRQRQLHEMSLRQLARLTGVCNPYLSQIERGLREPSETVVDALANALDMTTEALYGAAGIRDEADEDAEESAVLVAIEQDVNLKPRQRRALVETYNAFVTANGGPRPRPRSTHRS